MNRTRSAGIVFTLLFVVLVSQSAHAQVEKAYVTNFLGNTVTVINTDTNTIETVVPLGINPDEIAINSTCTLAYVANRTSNSISVINLRSNTVQNTFTFQNPAAPDIAVLTPDDSKFYTEGIGEVIVLSVNGPNLSVLTTIPINGFPQTMAVTPDGSKVFGATSNDYFVIDTATNTIITTVPIAGPFDVNEFTISPDGQTAYLTDFQAFLSANSGLIISVATNQVTGFLPNPVNAGSATNLGIVPDGSKGYLTQFNRDFVAIYDPGSNTYSGSTVIGLRGQSMAFTEDGGRVYIVRGLSSDPIAAVSVLNTANNQLIDTIDLPLDDSPIDIAICAPPISTVPTVSEWGMIIMAGVFAMAGLFFLRRRATV